jgi:ankyrin repeat protein
MVGGGNLCLTQNGDTALIMSARIHRRGCMRALLKSGADTNAQNNVRHSAHFFSCFSVNALILMSVSSFFNHLWDRLFMVCIVRWRIACVYPTQDGQTALMIAVQENSDDSVRLLLKRGADMKIKDKVPHKICHFPHFVRASCDFDSF